MELFEAKCRCLAHKTFQQWGAMKSDHICRTRKCKTTNFLTLLIPPTNLITFPPGRKSAARIPFPLWPSRISSVLFVLRFHRLIIPLADLEMKLQIFLIPSVLKVKLSINNYYSRREGGRESWAVEFSITWQQILTRKNTHPPSRFQFTFLHPSFFHNINLPGVPNNTKEKPLQIYQCFPNKWKEGWQNTRGESEGSTFFIELRLKYLPRK